MTPELSFDGCGINGPDQFRTPIAKFCKPRSDESENYGPLFAAAPDMKHALETIADRLEAWAETHERLAQTTVSVDRSSHENRAANYRELIRIARESLPQ